MAKHKFWRVLTRVHKWAGLVLGIQIVLWFSSGLFMSFFSIDKVHGDHIAEKQLSVLSGVQTISAQQAMTYYSGDAIYGAHLRSALGAPIWEINGNRGVIHVDAVKDELWQGVREADIKQVASQYYKGDAKIKSALLFTETPPKDFRKFVPIWQVEFDDRSHTRLYISPQTGALVNVRTRLWRAFDFMWMLHIMDYKERDNINLWWLKLAAFAALLFALSGVGLVIHRVFLRPRPKRKT